MLFRSADIAFPRPGKGETPFLVVDAALPDGAAEVVVGDTVIAVSILGMPVGRIPDVDPALCARLCASPRVRLVEVAGTAPRVREAHCRALEGRSQR